MKLPTKKKIGRPRKKPAPALGSPDQEVGVTARGQRRKTREAAAVNVPPLQDDDESTGEPMSPEVTVAKVKEFMDLLEQLRQLEYREECQKSFLAFLKHMWPSILIGEHHKIMIEKLEAVARGELKRVILNMPPRHGKSLIASEYFAMWYAGNHPSNKIMEATHTVSLSEDFGRKVRNGIMSERFQEIFPGITIAADSKAAGKWAIRNSRDKGARQGEANYVGVGTAIAGKGADLFLIDDPHSEQDLSDNAFENAWQWYTQGPRQRLQPGAAIILIQTRWSKKDLTARLVNKARSDPKADQWEVIELPAILPSGKPLWDYFTLKELEAIKAQNFASWQGQYMQDPTSDDAAILKRDWWKVWDKKDYQGRALLPKLEYVMQTYDTAFGRTEKSDYSAIQTWGIFRHEQTGMPCMLLMDAYRDRLDFPALKKFAYRHYREWEPDIVVIEMRATGTSLAQEMRKVGIPIGEFTPTRGNDKVARAHAASPTLESGQVYILDETSHWELVEECASFPNGDHDDQVDAFTLAVLRFRKGGFIRLEDDEEDEEVLVSAANYY